MEALFLYLLKSAICLSIFAAIYFLFLRKETYFRFNRLFLLSGLIISIILPLWQWHYTVEVAQAPLVQTIELPALNAALTGMASAQTPDKPLTILLLIYTIGILAVLLYHFYGVMKIGRWLRRGRQTKWNGLIVVSNDSSAGTFSFFNKIFFNEQLITSEAERVLILRHEQAHVQQKHWVDLTLVHLLAVVQWFNPLVYLYRKFIKDNQEYLADEAVLQHETPRAVYQAVLINHTLKIPVFNITNSFSNNQINRIKMMKNKSKSKIKRLSVLLALPALACSLWAFSVPEYVYIPGDDMVVHTVVVEKELPDDVFYFIDDEESTKEEVENLDPDKIRVVNIYDEGWGVPFEGAEKQGVILVYTKEYKKKKADAFKNKNKKNDIPKDKKITFTANRLKNEKTGEWEESFVYCPIIFIDGKEVSTEYYLNEFDHESECGETVLVPKVAKRLYGDKAKNGIVVIHTKKGPPSESLIEHSRNMVETSENILIIINGEEKDRSALNDIDPQTIESMDVYKDKTAAELYGEKGKDGVIVITTKKIE